MSRSSGLGVLAYGKETHYEKFDEADVESEAKAHGTEIEQLRAQVSSLTVLVQQLAQQVQALQEARLPKLPRRKEQLSKDGRPIEACGSDSSAPASVEVDLRTFLVDLDERVSSVVRSTREDIDGLREQFQQSLAERRSVSFGELHHIEVGTHGALVPSQDPEKSEWSRAQQLQAQVEVVNERGQHISAKEPALQANRNEPVELNQLMIDANPKLPPNGKSDMQNCTPEERFFLTSLSVSPAA